MTIQHQNQPYYQNYELNIFMYIGQKEDEYNALDFLGNSPKCLKERILETSYYLWYKFDKNIHIAPNFLRNRPMSENDLKGFFYPDISFENLHQYDGIIFELNNHNVYILIYWSNS